MNKLPSHFAGRDPIDQYHGPEGRDPIDELLGPEGRIGQRLPSYEPRQAQLVMARQVLRTLETNERLLVEAGTGTGKTLAYLVPAVLSEKRVAISTGTKTLEEQIFGRDIPLLMDLLGVELSVACMKGISNYLCRRRLEEIRRAPPLLPDRDLDRLLAWASFTESGDRAELEAFPDDSALWRELSPTPETRIGPPCRFFEACFVTRMRRQAAEARIVVVNHHLLLADLALRSQDPSARVLPAYEALIVDEAHHLEQVATSFFSRDLSPSALSGLLHDARRAAHLERDAAAETLCDQLEGSSAQLFHLLARELPSLRSTSGPDERGVGRLRLLDPPLVGTLLQPYFLLDSALEALGQHLHLRSAGQEELENLAGRLESARETLALFAEAPGQGFIFWAEPGRAGPSLHASPVEVSTLLRRTLFAEEIPIVLTSATLATPGAPPGSPLALKAPSKRGISSQPTLRYFRQRVGLDEDLDTEELILPSPFSFEQQALLYVPRDLPPPAHPDFMLRASLRAGQLIEITSGRALFLFTSYRNMKAARALLAGQIPYPLLCQGEQPRSLLLDRFRSEVSSVLLATASFWEGVDIVGESLSLVIIDKLPFAVPGDPLTAARLELLREQGLDPFTSYQLPQAALALKQGFGRLIRHRSDAGIVAILDRRLLERAYGQVLLSALPPCPRSSDLLRARAFAKEVLAPRRS